MKRHFFKANIQMANKYINVFNITNHQEIQVKTTMWYHLMPVKMAMINKKMSVGEDAE